MKKQDLVLYKKQNNTYRAIIKTNHARLVYWEINRNQDTVEVIECIYVDRIRRGEYYAVPEKHITKNFDYSKMLEIIASELDRRYFGIEITDKFAELSRDEFITITTKDDKYNFLIFVGEGVPVNGIPPIIKTRFKNRIHRSIYLEMHYENGKGVIKDCRYYDRKYKGRNRVIPETLTTVFFDYNRQAILNIINNELYASFTHIIFITDGSIDINNEVALCGNV